jgi:hypothetical protein
MYKRGVEFAFGMIFSISLVLIGFIILIVFLVGLDVEDISYDESCRLSVLSRGSLPVGSADYVPLKCSTKKICIYNDGFDKTCANFIGEKNIIYIKVPDDKIEAKKIIEKTVVENMYNCWDIMGQGKIDLFGGLSQKLSLSSAQPTCFICSRIAISNAFENNNLGKEILDSVNFNEYMENNIPSGASENYISLMSDGKTNTYSNVAVNLPNTVTSSKDISENTLSKTELSIIFSQIRVDDPLNVVKNVFVTAGVGLAGSFAIAPITVVKTAVNVALKPVVSIGGLVLVGAYAGYAYSTASKSVSIASLYCGQFSGGEKGKSGCSAIQIVPYEVDYVNKMCPFIEGEA